MREVEWLGKHPAFLTILFISSYTRSPASEIGIGHNHYTGISNKSRDSSVGIALGYGLDDWSSRIRFPAGAENFSLHHRVQNGSGAHPSSYPMGTRGSLPGGKAARA
jgi:hypothetical protein